MCIYIYIYIHILSLSLSISLSLYLSLSIYIYIYMCLRVSGHASSGSVISEGWDSRRDSQTRESRLASASESLRRCSELRRPDPFFPQIERSCWLLLWTFVRVSTRHSQRIHINFVSCLRACLLKASASRSGLEGGFATSSVGG